MVKIVTWTPDSHTCMCWLIPDEVSLNDVKITSTIVVICVHNATVYKGILEERVLQREWQ